MIRPTIYRTKLSLACEQAHIATTSKQASFITKIITCVATGAKSMNEVAGEESVGEASQWEASPARRLSLSSQTTLLVPPTMPAGSQVKFRFFWKLFRKITEDSEPNLQTWLLHGFYFAFSFIVISYYSYHLWSNIHASSAISFNFNAANLSLEELSIFV